VDAVLVGQAFRWFERDRALDEIARVLRPGGSVGLLWNRIRPGKPWIGEIAQLMRKASHTVELEPPWHSRVDLSDPEWRGLTHGQETDAERLVDSVRSRSRVILQSDEERDAVLARVRELARLCGSDYQRWNQRENLDPVPPRRIAAERNHPCCGRRPAFRPRTPAAARSCGAIRDDGEPRRITVQRGKVACLTVCRILAPTSARHAPARAPRAYARTRAAPARPRRSRPRRWFRPTTSSVV
jgi:hypothetical protein